MLAALTVVALIAPGAAFGAASTKKPAPKPKPVPSADDKRSVTHHSITIGGTTIRYTATAGTIVLKDDKDEPEASVFYVAYTKDGMPAADRPVTFVYNGGPGCASAPLHMLGFGPRKVAVENATPNAGAPARVVDNPDTLLDATDLVFIDAPGTGYSTLFPKTDPKTIYGIDQDAAAFAQFIRRYITFNERWNSPKFLFGESYGTPRSAALVDRLLTQDTIAMNGVVLLSSVLDFDTIAPGPGNDLPYITYLPTEAATHWYHDKAANKGSLQSAVDRARTFANGAYASALLMGDRLPHEQFVSIAKQVAELTGVSETYVEHSDLRMQPQRFEKELLREEGLQTGRLDARYIGYDEDQVGDSAEFDPADSYTSPVLQSGFISYVRGELNWKTDAPYPQCAFDVNGKWDYSRKGTWNWLAPTTSADLQDALSQNPKLRVFVGAGYYDMATPFGAAEWTFSHLDLHPDLRSHVSWGYYPSGHMVYLNPESHASLTRDVAHFIEKTDNQ